MNIRRRIHEPFIKSTQVCRERRYYVMSLMVSGKMFGAGNCSVLPISEPTFKPQRVVVNNLSHSKFAY